MAVAHPPHPGQLIAAAYLKPDRLSERDLAARLGVAASTLKRILAGVGDVTPDMAQRLSKVLGRSPENWLAMQNNHALWRAKHFARLAAAGEMRRH